MAATRTSNTKARRGVRSGSTGDAEPARVLLFCPVCQSPRARLAAELPEARVYLCDACSSEFSIARKRPPTREE